jgi:hypothetical protein
MQITRARKGMKLMTGKIRVLPAVNLLRLISRPVKDGVIGVRGIARLCFQRDQREMDSLFGTGNTGQKIMTAAVRKENTAAVETQKTLAPRFPGRDSAKPRLRPAP